jgi:hypothetical protein
MKKNLLNMSMLMIAITLMAASSFAQPAQPVSGRMFAGETMKFDGKFNKLKISFSVAELSFDSILAPNGSDLIIKGEAVSKGTLTKLFRFSFLQHYESTVDLNNNFRILKTTKHDVQKQRVRDSEAIFDYGQHRVTFVETDPKDVTRPPRRIASEIADHMNDMVSGIYSLRLMTLKNGDHLTIKVSDSGLIYEVPVNVTGREQVSTILGKIWCLKVEPDIFGPGRLIETQNGKMVIWMTDDERHVPVRTQINASIGKVEIRLKSYQKPVVAAGNQPT